ncbi:MAG: TrbG/VirB9 family P-type conjugative transfer protein [Albidovulum sp.]|uniref:TrbG/VirB9 family P-type conjugative transfer protein n=1 Tax=Albidovulum sp. TaxID=1872424 RepID=UPI003C99880E
MKLALTGATVAAFLFTALPGAAETTSKSGKLDPRVTYATYQSGQVYNVYTGLRRVTLVELGDGERIQSIAIGDLDSFRIDRLEGENLFIIKPVTPGVSTNLTVETNRRLYFLNVVSTTQRQPMYSVKFTVPGTKRNTASAAPALPAKPMKYAILSKRQMPKFTPRAIGDDGYRTTFRIPNGAPMPTIFRADEKGREYSVNAMVRGTTITVSTRSDRWVLRLGDEFVCIEGKE